MFDKLERAKMFSLLSSRHVLFVDNPFNDGKDQWFVIDNFTEYNPSNHIHFNELVSGKCITQLMNNVIEYDQALFLTKLDEIPRINIKFPNGVRWFKIKI